MSTIAIFFVIVFGVILPTSTLGIEFFTGMSGSEYFDPIPTPWHILVVFLVPLSNAIVLGYVLRKSKVPPYFTGYLSALAFCIGALYSIPYLPILPIAVPAILFYGIGLLPLSPALSAISALILRRGLKRRGLLGENGRVPGRRKALVTVLGIVCALEAQPLVTNIGLTMAVSPKESTSQRGIDLLRNFGDRDIILGICFGRQGRMVDPFTALVRSSNSYRLTTDRARELYFQVTGESFLSAKPPRSVRNSAYDSSWFFDVNQGTRVIGRKSQDLELITSTIGGSVDASSALAYTEWTMVFRNSGYTQREARTHIALPPGGLVSRLTLWVNGEEKEATFAARGKVERAYQQVVAARRDPVLVTSDGPDRILLQLFPVPPSGTMKVRIGITSPLRLTAEQQPIFTLPSFRDGNFQIGDQFRHDLWIDSKMVGTVKKWDIRGNTQDDGSFSVRGTLTTDELSQGEIEYPAIEMGSSSYTDDPQAPGQNQIIQRFERIPLPRKEQVIAVIDASRTLESKRGEIEELLSHLRGKVDVEIILATDQVQPRAAFQHRSIARDSKDFSEEIRNAMESVSFRGGQDNIPALSKALDVSQGSKRSIVLWWHGPQPIRSASTESFLQRVERMQALPQVYDIEVGNGENSILQELDRMQIIQAAPALSERLSSLVDHLVSEDSQVSVTRLKLPAPEANLPSTARKTSSHLARLWAFDEVRRGIQSRSKALQDTVGVLGAAYSIVTPFTGAVVLETQAQYDANGLTPAKPLDGNVPTVPEPETYALMVVALLIFVATVRKQRGAVGRWYGRGGVCAA